VARTQAGTVQVAGRQERGGGQPPPPPRLGQSGSLQRPASLPRRAQVGNEAAVLGFVGAPFTLATYIIEGGSSKNFAHTKKMAFSDPKVRRGASGEAPARASRPPPPGGLGWAGLRWAGLGWAGLGAHPAPVPGPVAGCAPWRQTCLPCMPPVPP
jgi:hypothetical protein